MTAQVKLLGGLFANRHVFASVAFVMVEMDDAAVDAMGDQRAANVARGAADRDPQTMAAFAFDESLQSVGRGTVGEWNARQVEHKSPGPPPYVIERGSDHACGAKKNGPEMR